MQPYQQWHTLPREPLVAKKYDPLEGSKLDEFVDPNSTAPLYLQIKSLSTNFNVSIEARNWMSTLLSVFDIVASKLLRASRFKLWDRDYIVRSEYERKYGTYPSPSKMSGLVVAARLLSYREFLSEFRVAGNDCRNSAGKVLFEYVPKADNKDEWGTTRGGDRNYWKHNFLGEEECRAHRPINGENADNDPMRRWGIYVDERGPRSGLVQRDGPFRRVMACCGQPVGETDGCWMSLVDGQPFGAPVLYEVFTRNFWPELNKDRSVVSSETLKQDYVVGTAYKDIDFFVVLHNKIQNHLKIASEIMSESIVAYANKLSKRVLTYSPTSDESIISLPDCDELITLVKLIFEYNKPQGAVLPTNIKAWIDEHFFKVKEMQDRVKGLVINAFKKKMLAQMAQKMVEEIKKRVPLFMLQFNNLNTVNKGWLPKGLQSDLEYFFEKPYDIFKQINATLFNDIETSVTGKTAFHNTTKINNEVVSLYKTIKISDSKSFVETNDEKILYAHITKESETEPAIKFVDARQILFVSIWEFYILSSYDILINNKALEEFKITSLEFYNRLFEIIVGNDDYTFNHKAVLSNNALKKVYQLAADTFPKDWRGLFKIQLEVLSKIPESKPKPSEKFKAITRNTMESYITAFTNQVEFANMMNGKLIGTVLETTLNYLFKEMYDIFKSKRMLVYVEALYDIEKSVISNPALYITTKNANNDFSLYKNVKILDSNATVETNDEKIIFTRITKKDEKFVDVRQILILGMWEMYILFSRDIIINNDADMHVKEFTTASRKFYKKLLHIIVGNDQYDFNFGTKLSTDTLAAVYQLAIDNFPVEWKSFFEKKINFFSKDTQEVLSEVEILDCFQTEGGFIDTKLVNECIVCPLKERIQARLERGHDPTPYEYMSLVGDNARVPIPALENKQRVHDLHVKYYHALANVAACLDETPEDDDLSVEKRRELVDALVSQWPVEYYKEHGYE